MINVGLSVSFADLSMKDFLNVAAEVDNGGFSLLSVVEAFRDGFTPLAAAALRTSRIRLGPGVVNCFTRSPLLIAQSIASIDELAGGRVFLGLGSSFKLMVEGEHGVSWRNPVQRMREYIAVLRGLLRSERITHHGKILNFEDIGLAFKPVRSDLPIYLAAVGPRMLSLVGEAADGVFLDVCYTVDYVKDARGIIVEAARTHHRRASDLLVGGYLITAVDNIRRRAFKAIKENITWYLSKPQFKPILHQAGFEKQAEKITRAYDSGDFSEAARLVPDELVEKMTAAGSAEECRMRVQEYRDAGLDLPILYPAGSPQKAAIERTIRAFTR